MPVEASSSDSLLGMLILGFIGWVACIALAIYVAIQKGRTELEAFTIAGIFGPFGVLIVALLPTLEGKSKPLAESMSESTATAKKTWKNPTEEDWKDWIDWTDAKTEEGEKHAKQVAYAKYMNAFGPKVTDVKRTPDGSVGFRCICGHPHTASASKSGKVVACTVCKLHFVVPAVPEATP